jgi:hypothetical protein
VPAGRRQIVLEVEVKGIAIFIEAARYLALGVVVV